MAQLNTPNVKLPFGVEEFNNCKIINVQFPKTNATYNFLLLIEQAEKEEMENLPKDVEFISSIKRKGTFPPLLRLKLRKAKGKTITAKITDEDGAPGTIIDLVKGSKLKVKVMKGKTWNKAGKAGVNWIATEIKIRNFEENPFS